MKEYRQQAKILRAMAHPMRLQILEALVRGPACVCELTAITGRRQACISQHLMLLRQTGLVKRTRMGLNMRYELATELARNLLHSVLEDPQTNHSNPRDVKAYEQHAKQEASTMLLNERMDIGHSVLKRCRTLAVVGVSQDKQKYGYEVFEALINKGYQVYPVNPKYTSVDDHPCYPSLQALPETPEVVVTATPPAVTEKVAETCAQLSIRTLWMPPETWSEKSVEICNTHGIQEIHDLCLVFALKSLK